DAFTHGPIEPTNEVADGIRRRALSFVERLTRTACEQFESLQRIHEGKAGTPWPDRDVSEGTALARIIDAIGMQLYFASGASASRGKRGERMPQEKRLFEEAFNVLELLASVGLPSVAYHLVETFEHFIAEDPPRVFSLIGTTIVSGRRGGYQ